MTEQNQQLETLRDRLRDLDEQLLDLVEERLDTVREIGEVKEEEQLSTRDFEQEKRVIERGRSIARDLGLTPDLAEDLLLRLIDESLKVQEQDRVRRTSRGADQDVLLIGGAGKMGRWFARFLDSQSYEVVIADPDGPVEGYGYLPDWPDQPIGHDLIIITTPIRQTRRVLDTLEEQQPDGTVIDIASIKNPIAGKLKQLSESGVSVTSIHPMFSPNVKLLSGKHVIFIDLEDGEAVSDAKQLFENTMVECVDMSLEEHDRAIAYVLGLSHLVNLTFFTALEQSGKEAPDLADISSTTFDRQLRIASDVANEDPHLYYEIQALNEFNPDAISAFRQALSDVTDAISGQKEEAFVDLMLSGRTYLSDRKDDE